MPKIVLPVVINYGSGDPNGVVSGNVKDMYLDVASDTQLWLKTSNNSSTGWVLSVVLKQRVPQ